MPRADPHPTADHHQPSTTTPARHLSLGRGLILVATIGLVLTVGAACGAITEPTSTGGGQATLTDPATDGDANSDANDGSALQATTIDRPQDTTTSSDPTTATTPATDPADTFCQGNPPTDIRFRSGATSATLAVTVSADQHVLYTLDVRADQILGITLDSTDPAAAVTLLPPGANPANVSSGFTAQILSPTSAGTYRICVAAGPTGTDYRLDVSVIDDNTPIRIDAPWCGDAVNDRGEIRFDPGATTGIVEGAVIRGERDLYTLDAAAGQFIEARLSSIEDNAVFDLRTPSGVSMADSRPDLRDILPEDGTYQLCIGSTRGNATYELDLGIFFP